MSETASTADTLKQSALLHARAVECVAEALCNFRIEKPAPGGHADQLARAILARLASLPDPILLTSMSEMEAGEKEAASATDELARLNLLLIRKNEALAVFATERMWTWHAYPSHYGWNGAADFKHPWTFARREAEATEPCDVGGTS